MQWKENLVQKAWIFWRVELQLNTEIPHFAVWSWFPYYCPLLDGPAHKCVDWRTTCNMVESFKDVHAIRVWKILSFLLQFRRKIRFYEHKLIRFSANNIIIKTLREFHLYVYLFLFPFHLHFNLIYIIALFPDAVELKWPLKWLNVLFQFRWTSREIGDSLLF